LRPAALDNQLAAFDDVAARRQDDAVEPRRVSPSVAAIR
jgi:hypothetical protein